MGSSSVVYVFSCEQMKIPPYLLISFTNRFKIISCSILETRDYIRNMGTELISMGCRDKHIALVGESSYEWICSCFSLMFIVLF